MVVGLVDRRMGGSLALTEQGRAELLEATPPALASWTIAGAVPLDAAAGSAPSDGIAPLPRCPDTACPR